MIKYKCRYMYNEWDCIVKCIEKKMEYTVLEFYSQYFNIKMHLGNIDNDSGVSFLNMTCLLNYYHQ